MVEFVRPTMGRDPSGRLSVQMPLWLPWLAAVVPTALVWRLRFRRVAPGHCRQCGYDLTGNVSGRCPECGECIEKADGGRGA